MKVFFRYILSLMLIALSCYFIINVVSKFFFHDFLYISPDLVGVEVNDASEILKKGDFKLNIMGEDYSKYEKGIIYSQIPEPGRKIKETRAFKVWISKGVREKKVPNLRGMSINGARAVAREDGFEIVGVAYAKNNNVPINTILATDPEKDAILSGERIPINVLINGEESGVIIRVPKLIGLKLNTATVIARDKGFEIGNVTYKESENKESEKGIIIGVSKKAGERLRTGSRIDVIVSK